MLKISKFETATQMTVFFVCRGINPIGIGFHSSAYKKDRGLRSASVRTAGSGAAHDGVRGHQKSAAYGQLQPHCNIRATFNTAHTHYFRIHQFNDISGVCRLGFVH